MKSGKRKAESGNIGDRPKATSPCATGFASACRNAALAEPVAPRGEQKAESGKPKAGLLYFGFRRSAFRFGPLHFPFSAFRSRLFPPGFTLLEVLLSLVLSVLVLAIVATAVSLHMRLLNSSRTDIEQSQLARAVLRQMADDLHGAVAYVPQVTSGVTAASLTAGLQNAITQESQQEGITPAQATTASGSSTASLSTSSTPGLYGDTQTLQFDFTRLTQATVSNSNSASSNNVSPTADLRTVTYTLAGNALGSANGGNGQGMVRYEMDRAAAVQSQSTGQYTQDLANQTPIAPEVTDLEFSYYDGAEWNDQWDTSQQGALPMAVQIVISVARTASGGGTLPAGPSAASGNPSDNSVRTYWLKVALPAGVPSSSGTATTSTSGTGS
jgi:type II secretory pathway component PulJ